ncbi:MAG TPA: hypothetical protein VIL16_24035 [Trebonia sp.]|jgi:hypothetical protein
MSSLDASADTVTLWRPTGQEELDLVAASDWRAWPPRLPEQPIFYPVLNRWYAAKIAREWNVRSGGVGYVTSFDVGKAYLDQFPVQQAGGREVLEYWIPAEELAEFNENITGKIREVACYVGPVTEEEFTRTEAALGQRFPDAWRAYLTGDAWFSRGWMETGSYLALLTPVKSREIVEAWDTSAELHPGVMMLGSNGSRETLVVDSRDPLSPVTMVDITSEGWADALLQMPVEQFIREVEAGTFEFSWE